MYPHNLRKLKTLIFCVLDLITDTEHRFTSLDDEYERSQAIVGC
jgi:hypothetical protein